jgi:hypothetical protein
MDLTERRAGAARHPWELARGGFFVRLVIDSTRGPVDVLDLGAGDGWFAERLLQQLPAGSTITCWDINYTPDDLTEALPVGVTRTALRPDRTFDVVLLLDVVEHVADDDGFLRDIAVPLLATAGVLVFSVPAYQALFSSHDEFLGHHRRYSPTAARRLLERHLAVDREGPLFMSLLPPRAAGVGIERLRRRSGWTPDPEGVGGWTGGPAVTRAITGVLNGDARLGSALASKGFRLPGLSYWAVCSARRPSPGVPGR